MLYGLPLYMRPPNVLKYTMHIIIEHFVFKFCENVINLIIDAHSISKYSNLYSTITVKILIYSNKTINSLVLINFYFINALQHKC